MNKGKLMRKETNKDAWSTLTHGAMHWKSPTVGPHLASVWCQPKDQNLAHTLHSSTTANFQPSKGCCCTLRFYGYRINGQRVGGHSMQWAETIGYLMVKIN